MKSLLFITLALLLILTASNVYARDNKASCEKWCSTEESCDKCTSVVSCGTGFHSIASFKGSGKNYYACRKTPYGNQSERNRDACKDFCDKTESCKKCSSSVGCGKGLTKIMSFGGSGKNWYACRETHHSRMSEANKENCENWCSKNELCVRCSTIRECGKGQTSMKHFDGSGKNWHACRKTGSASNKQACVQWCGEKEKCKKCAKVAGCGKGYKSMKMFKGPGKNWFACEKR